MAEPFSGHNVREVRVLSKPPDHPRPSVSISVPPEDTERDIKKPGSLFPVLSGMKAGDPRDGPPPEGEAQLHDKAAKCSRAWPCLRIMQSPSLFSPALASAPTDDSRLTRPPSYLELTREAQALEALLQAKREEAGLLRQLRELDQKQEPGLRCGLRTPPKSKEVLGTVRMTTSGEEDENNPLTIKKQGYRPLKLECVKSAASLGPCPLYPAPFGIPE